MKRLPLDYAVRNLGRSPLRLGLSVLGSALVVLLALAAGGFVRGMDQSLRTPGGGQNVILLGAGSEESVERSEILSTTPSLVMASVPGIRTLGGAAFVSPEVHMQTTVKPGESDAHETQLLVRGVTPAAFLVHPGVRVSEGRLPAPGADEVIVGRMAKTKLGIDTDASTVGRTVFFYERTWQVVGELEAPRSVVESEIWAALTDLQIASRRDNLSCVVLTLGDGGDFDDVDAFARQRLDLELIAMREGDYYASLSAFFSPLRAMVWVTSVLIASGGILGGLNTMYAAFASRVREVGMLQALGFPRRAIVLSLAQESVVAAAAGTLIALLIGLIALDGLQVPFSLGVFGLVMDSQVMLVGIIAGMLVGLVGALPAAIRCLRLPIPEALKSG